MAPTHGEILANMGRSTPYRILWAILTQDKRACEQRFYQPPKGCAKEQATYCQLIYVLGGIPCTLSVYAHQDRVKQARDEAEKWLALSPDERIQNQGSFLYWVLANPSAPGHTEALEKHPNPLEV